MVAAATHNLCEAANALVAGHTSEEKLIGAAKQVAGSTAQLLLACKVKADPDSQPMRRLEDASNAVRKATENLVKAAQSALDNNANDDHLDLSEDQKVTLDGGATSYMIQQINARAEVLRMERELEEARKKLTVIHQRRYQTDSEQSEQSGYESSGYDEASFRKVYHSSPYPKKLSTPKQSFQQQHFTSQQQHQVVGDSHQQQTQQQQQHTIESGPSFNESLERFRLATSSGGESDGELSHLNPNQNQQSTSVFRQSRSSTQKTSSNLTSRSVEEQRTIITRNSQKSYHIE